MAVADVMVTKPGGLSISEALVSNLPLIFFNAIPGQEANNVRVLSGFNIGLGTKSVDDIINEIKKLSQSAEYLEKTKENIKQLARPTAASEIVKLIS